MLVHQCYQLHSILILTKNKFVKLIHPRIEPLIKIWRLFSINSLVLNYTELDFVSPCFNIIFHTCQKVLSRNYLTFLNCCTSIIGLVIPIDDQNRMKGFTISYYVVLVLGRLCSHFWFVVWIYELQLQTFISYHLLQIIFLVILK